MRKIVKNSVPAETSLDYSYNVHISFLGKINLTIGIK